MRQLPGAAPGADAAPLGVIDAGMEGGVVAKPARKGRGPNQAQAAEADKRPAPACRVDQRLGGHGRDRSAQQGRRVDHPLGRAARRRLEPARQHARGIGKGPGLARAKEETNQQEHDETVQDDRHPPAHAREAKVPTAVQRKSPDATGEHREHGPPDDDSRQHPARAEPVSQAARGNLEQAIGDGEGSQHKAHLGMRNAEFRLHVRRGLADADAVKIENERQGAEKRQHAVTDPRCRCM